MNRELHLEPEEAEDLVALGQTFGVLGSFFTEEGGSPEALRMCISSLRSGADLLQRVVDRWEGK